MGLDVQFTLEKQQVRLSVTVEFGSRQIVFEGQNLPDATACLVQMGLLRVSVTKSNEEPAAPAPLERYVADDSSANQPETGSSTETRCVPTRFR